MPGLSHASPLQYYLNSYYGTDTYTPQLGYYRTTSVTPRTTTVMPVTPSVSTQPYATRDTRARYNYYSLLRRVRPTTSTTTTTTPATRYRTSNYAWYGSRYPLVNRAVDYSQTRLVASMQQVLPAVPGLTYPGAIRFAEMGIAHQRQSLSSQFQEAIVVNDATFTIESNNSDYRLWTDFVLVVDDTAYPFRSDGTVTVDLDERLASGNSDSHTLRLGLRDSSLWGRISGSFRVRLTGMTAATEQSHRVVAARLDGTLLSNYIGFSGAPSAVTGTGITGLGDEILGRNLTAGETARVLNLHLRPEWSDIVIRSLTFTNTYGSTADSSIDYAKLVDTRTGTVIDTGTFAGGSVKFTMTPGLSISRQEDKYLDVVLVINPSVSATAGHQIALSLSNLDGYNTATSQNITTGEWQFLTQPTTFTIGQGGIAIAASSTQISTLAVTPGTPAPVYRFRVSNPSTSAAALGRVSFDIALDGVAYDGGMSASDFVLSRVVGNTEVSTGDFTPSISGSKVYFDAVNEIYLSPGTSLEFLLKINLVDSNPSLMNERVTIYTLGNSSYSTGTLSALRTAGAAFIYSDMSAPGHSTATGDWIASITVSGLPDIGTTIER